ncbi:hypothetical protein FOZ61_007249 [Perkinsus olseni]|uniref:Uncharacterized protein n=1 Tax=Perkinsus olseni TaxID=32597 RepID=A0A7J6LA25_PEROL|nr:hypothetical protein FOZ61_007249 [Perkinsus olseni]KAF4656710.1 hypothetical protein FOL46_007718 [Perkinsus olseni]
MDTISPLLSFSPRKFCPSPASIIRFFRYGNDESLFVIGSPNEESVMVFRYSAAGDQPQLEEVSELPDHKYGVSDIAVNCVGTVIVTSGLDSTVRVWKRSRQGKYEHYRNIPAVGGKTIDIGDIDHIAILTREAGRYNVLVSVGSAGGKIHFTDLATDASSESTAAVRGGKRPARRLIPPVDCLYRGAKKTYLGCVTAMHLSSDGSYLAYGTSSGYVGLARLICEVEDNNLRLECDLRGVLQCFKSAVASPVRSLAMHGDTLLVGGEANVGRIVALDMLRVSGYLVEDSGEKSNSSGTKSRKTSNPAVLGSIPLNYSSRLRSILISEAPGLQPANFLLSFVSSDGTVQTHVLPDGPDAAWADGRAPETVNQLDLRNKGAQKLTHVTICAAVTAALKSSKDSQWSDCVAVALANGKMEIYKIRQCAAPKMPELPIEVEGGVFDMFKSAASQHRQLNVGEDWNQDINRHYQQGPPTTGVTASSHSDAAGQQENNDVVMTDDTPAAQPPPPLITSTQPVSGS